MWWVGNRVADLYLGTLSVRLIAKGQVFLAETCEGVDDALAKVANATSLLPPGCQVRVWMSGGLCRPFLLPDVAGAADEKEWQQVAQHLVEDLTGLVGPCRVWLDTGQRSPRLAVAVPDSIFSRLENAMVRVRLMSLRPWWSEVLRHHVKVKTEGQDNELAIRDCDSLTILLAKADTFLSVQTYSLVGLEVQTLIDRALFAASWPTNSVAQVDLVASKKLTVGEQYQAPLGRAVFAADSVA